MTVLDEYTCEACGTACIRPRVRGQRPRWCEGCRAQGIRAKTCPRCGTQGYWRQSVVHCSRACAARPKLGPPEPPQVPKPKRWPASPSSRIFITDCVVCDTTFSTPYTISTCSDACKETHRLDLKRAGRDRRRARRRDAFVANVHRRQILERDGFTCQLCGDPLDMGQQVPHPDAPTIDHVVPLAAGGTHEPSNAQAAHFWCNADKSDALPVAAPSHPTRWPVAPASPQKAPVRHSAVLSLVFFPLGVVP
jgi:5-methylcytosine-specific restriction endonuclease McrA